MPAESTGGVLYEVVDEIGLEVDRFRNARGASAERLYLTGIEFALVAAGYLAARFVRGFVRGLKRGIDEAELDPAKLGERLGRWTIGQIDTRTRGLVPRAEALFTEREDRSRQESNAIGDEVTETLAAATSLEEELPERVRGHGLADGIADLSDGLIENGWTRERADVLAERVAARLLAASASV